ncbi:MAG TPA: LPS assembly lipoprotein LptE [Mucilaginibacter sp.]|jgi:hypothetical protein|nr:LPS assembly lipoprotein LptE [Mucilaginibacter sp.]
MKRLLGSIIVLSAFIFVSPGCSYKLNSQAIPDGMRTIYIGFFENDAALVVPTLSQTFTEALKSRIRSTTRLSIINSESNANKVDANMTGAITEYHFAPTSIQATNPNAPPIANAEALTITVRVKFLYDADKKLNFEQTFTEHVNYTGDISTQETGLIQTVTKQLVDDICNKAFNNW